MRSRIVTALMFLLASAISFVVVVFNLSIHLMQGILLMMLLLLLILTRFVLGKPKAGKTPLYLRAGVLFSVTIFVQILILSSGGFQSPFFILIHLFALSVGFLINFGSGLLILMLSIATLLVKYFLVDINNGTLDIASLILYVVSLLVIIPLMVLSSKYYRLKDGLLSLLKNELLLRRSQQESILEGLREIIFITDKNLHVISFNRAAEASVLLAKTEILQKPVFDLMLLRDKSGRLLDSSSFPLQDVIDEKKDLKLLDLLFMVKNSTTFRHVSMMIRPVLGLNGEVDQLTFIIEDQQAAQPQEEEQSDVNLEQARIRYQAMLEEMSNNLKAQGLVDLANRMKLIERIEQDILTTFEIQDEGFYPHKKPIDLAKICRSIVDRQVSLAQAMGVELHFELPDFSQEEAAALLPAGFSKLQQQFHLQITPDQLTGPYFTAAVDTGMFELLIQKILDLSLLLSSNMANSKATLSIVRTSQGKLDISVSCSYPLHPSQYSMLFVPYYIGLLGSNNLRMGSGLEGVLAKSLAQKQAIPIKIEADSTQGGVRIVLEIERYLKKQELKTG